MVIHHRNDPSKLFLWTAASEGMLSKPPWRKACDFCWLITTRVRGAVSFFAIIGSYTYVSLKKFKKEEHCVKESQAVPRELVEEDARLK